MSTTMNDLRPKQTDNQLLVKDYIARTPGITAEDVVNHFCGYELYGRDEIANAVENLVWNQYVKRDKITAALTVRIGE